MGPGSAPHHFAGARVALRPGHERVESGAAPAQVASRIAPCPLDPRWSLCSGRPTGSARSAARRQAPAGPEYADERRGEPDSFRRRRLGKARLRRRRRAPAQRPFLHADQCEKADQHEAGGGSEHPAEQAGVIGPQRGRRRQQRLGAAPASGVTPKPASTIAPITATISALLSAREKFITPVAVPIPAAAPRSGCRRCRAGTPCRDRTRSRPGAP